MAVRWLGPDGPSWLPPAYRPLASSRGYRRLALGDLVSSIGDGMSVVAIAWQALLLAPAGSEGIAVGASLAAYTLPGIVTGLVLGSQLGRVRAKWLIVLDSSTRAAALGTAALLAWTGRLELGTFVGLLALSSLFHAWGVAGRRSWVVELVAEPDRLAANALLLTQQHVAYVIGPAIAGFVSDLWGPSAAIGLDALSFVALAIAVSGVPAGPAPLTRRGRGAVRALLSYPSIAGLLALTCVFYLLYGPVEVALPIFVRGRLEGDAATLGMLWTFFGAGAVLGGLATPLLRRARLWVIVVAIVSGWGLGMIALGFASSFVPAAAVMVVSGVVLGPYTTVCATALQSATRADDLAPVSAAWASFVVAATPLGSALGGPLVERFGGGRTILWSGVLTLAIGLVIGAVTVARRSASAEERDSVMPTARPGP